MKIVERQLGRKVVAKPPPLPPLVRHLWEAFLTISPQRGGGTHLPEPLLLAEVESYQRQFGVPLRPWEIKAILALDGAFRRKLRESMPKPPSTTGENTRSR